MYSEEDYQDMDIGQENATTKEDGNAELITLNLLSMIMQNKESWLFDQKYEVHSEVYSLFKIRIKKSRQSEKSIVLMLCSSEISSTMIY